MDDYINYNRVRYLKDKSRQEMKITMRISGMHCKSCEILISDALEEVGAKAKVDSEKGIAVIEFDEKKLTEDTIKRIIKKEGFMVN